MNPMQFLEQLALHAHHHKKMDNLIDSQSDKVKKAIFENDSSALKKLVSDDNYYADKTGVVSL